MYETTGGGRRVVPCSPATPLERNRRNKFGYNDVLTNKIRVEMEKRNLKDDPKKPLYIAASDLCLRLNLLGTFYGVYSTMPTVKGECVGIYYGSKVAKSKATKEQLNSLFIFEFSSKILIDGYDHLEQHCHSFLPYAQDALGVPGFSNNIYPLVKNGLVYFYAKKDLSANEEYLWERDRSGEFYKARKNLLPYPIWQQVEHLYFKAPARNIKQNQTRESDGDIEKINQTQGMIIFDTREILNNAIIFYLDDDDIVDTSDDDEGIISSVVSSRVSRRRTSINIEVDAATKIALRRVMRLLDQITLCCNLIVSSPVATSSLDGNDSSNNKYFRNLLYFRDQLIEINKRVMADINSINSQNQFDAIYERVVKRVNEAKEAISFAELFLHSRCEVESELNMSGKCQLDMTFSLKNVNILYYHNIVSKTWCKMNSLQWQNLSATTSSGKPIIFAHLVQ